MRVVMPSGLVTLLFTDIEGSTRLWENHPAEMQVALARHDQLVREAIDNAGGYVIKTVGDAFCAAFESAAAGVRAALHVQRALEMEPWPAEAPIRVRIALHSCVSEERDGDYYGTGANRVARLLAVGHGGQTLLSATTHELVSGQLPADVSVRDLGRHRLKDLLRPEHVFQVHITDLPDVVTPLRSLSNPALLHNLPEQLTSFVDRDREVKEVRELLELARLVTLSGAGGVGKTRLALQVAAELVDGSPDGVWLVELAPLSIPDLVALEVASALWVREQPGCPVLDTLIDALRDRRLVLLLDNCEHLLDAAAEVANALLRSCPGVTLLATGREPLGLAGEHVYRVPSLESPPLGASPALIASCSAPQLFAQRAAQVRSGLSLNDLHAAAVASICRRLDGIPLAIELAAARLSSLSVDEIDARLNQRFELLTRGDRAGLPRQQTLRALIDWSYDLLPPSARTVLGRLSTFAGGFTLPAAEAVCASGDVDETAILDLLAALVDKSLVEADEENGTTRYRLLETVRQYAAERLDNCGLAEADAARWAHRDCFLALSELAASKLRGPDQVAWLNRLDVERDNLRAAMAASLVDSDPEAGLRLLVALRLYWQSRGAREFSDALTRLIDRIDNNTPPALTVRAHVTATYAALYAQRFLAAVQSGEEAVRVAVGVGDDALHADASTALGCALCMVKDTRALGPLDEAVRAARRVGDRCLLGDALWGRGFALVTTGSGDYETCRADVEESLTLARTGGDVHGMAFASSLLGLMAFEAGDLVTARRHLTEAVELTRQLGGPADIVVHELNLGLLAVTLGDHDDAGRHLAEGLRIALKIGDRLGIASAVLMCALLASARGENERAVLLHGAADANIERLGRDYDQPEAGRREIDHQHLRALLGAMAFDTAYHHGRTFTHAAAVALASETASVGVQPSDIQRWP